MSHDVPGGGWAHPSCPLCTVIRLAPPRALLQVYDTEGTASSSPDGLVRLWVWPAEVEP